MKNALSKEKIISIIVIIICLISIIPIAYLALYSRPCADDYNYSINTYHLIQENGFNLFRLIIEAIKVDISFYKTWQGLYTSAFILSLPPSIFGSQYYFLGAWSLILLIFGSIHFFVKTLFWHLLKIKKYIFLVTIVLTSVVLTGLPVILEGLYWFNGAWNYMPFFFLTLINMALLLRYLTSNKKYYVILSVILSFVISGGNHVTSFLNVILLMIFSVVIFKKSKVSIISLISAIIGFIIMYIAPGTSARQGLLNEQGVIKTIFMSMRGYLSLIWHNISIQWIFVLGGLVFLAYLLLKEKKFSQKDLKWHPLVLEIVKIVIICGELCVPYKAMGNFGEGRVLNVIWCTYLFLNCFLVVYTVIWLSFRIKKNNPLKNEWLRYGCLVLLTVGMLFFLNSNSLKASRGIINGSAKEYVEAWDKRYQIMANTSDDIIYVDALPENELLLYIDITSFENDWKNIAWKSYYGKNVVVKEEENEKE